MQECLVVSWWHINEGNEALYYSYIEEGCKAFYFYLQIGQV